MNSNSIVEKLFATKEFATLPTVTMKILDMLENEKARESVDIRVLAKLIETDASLTLKLIRIANSPLFAIRDYVTSVQQASVILGLNKVTNIVLGISIFSKFMYSSVPGMQEVLNQYWWHTSSTGVVSKSLTKKIGHNFGDREFIGGLFHDIGKLAMMQCDFELFKKVIDLVNDDGNTILEAEKTIFGATHTEVGAEIAKRWHLPKDFAMIIKYKNDFTAAPPESRNIIAVINLSNMLCDMWGAGFYEGIQSIAFEDTPEWKHIEKISKNKNLDFEEITFSLEKDYVHSTEFLKIMGS